MKKMTVAAFLVLVFCSAAMADEVYSYTVVFDSNDIDGQYMTETFDTPNLLTGSAAENFSMSTITETCPGGCDGIPGFYDVIKEWYGQLSAPITDVGTYQFYFTEVTQGTMGADFGIAPFGVGGDWQIWGCPDCAVGDAVTGYVTVTDPPSDPTPEPSSFVLLVLGTCTLGLRGALRRKLSRA